MEYPGNHRTGPPYPADPRNAVTIRKSGSILVLLPGSYDEGLAAPFKKVLLKVSPHLKQLPLCIDDHIDKRDHIQHINDPILVQISRQRLCRVRFLQIQNEIND